MEPKPLFYLNHLFLKEEVVVLFLFLRSLMEKIPPTMVYQLDVQATIRFSTRLLQVFYPQF